MQRILLPVALVLCLGNGCAHQASKKGKDAQDIPAEAITIIQAYPDQGFTYKDNKLIFADGTAIVFDDGKEKDFMTKLDRSDVEDMFSFAYDRDGEPD